MCHDDRIGELIKLIPIFLICCGLIDYSDQGIVELERVSFEFAVRFQWADCEHSAWSWVMRLWVYICIFWATPKGLGAWKRWLGQAAAIGRCLMRALRALWGMMLRGLLNAAKRLRRIVGAMRGGDCEFPIRLKFRTGRRGARKARATLSVRTSGFGVEIEWRMRVWRRRKNRRR